MNKKEGKKVIAKCVEKNFHLPFFYDPGEGDICEQAQRVMGCLLHKGGGKGGKHGLAKMFKECCKEKFSTEDLKGNKIFNNKHSSHKFTKIHVYPRMCGKKENQRWKFEMFCEVFIGKEWNCKLE